MQSMFFVVQNGGQSKCNSDLHGLVRRADINGQYGFVDALEANGRVVIALASGEETVRAHKTNLKKGSLCDAPCRAPPAATVGRGRVNANWGDPEIRACSSASGAGLPITGLQGLGTALPS